MLLWVHRELVQIIGVLFLLSYIAIASLVASRVSKQWTLWVYHGLEDM